ncbi:HlyD family secretion protein [Sporobacter termitidis DSM 10068]|uniref:HlyD family secretion protein n=1 Tax=Sporobacter termitidis DSM 10068 TaxID=1123282 RepID=A0A1M5YXZ1_9FIRM|nr:HlyD family efflux transporter periplasmic adaptor subunit [Sporobacter termitidis]SHI16403.1 HlyD family secretion protein [Sporobacter termitidis DSM 10068]
MGDKDEKKKKHKDNEFGAGGTLSTLEPGEMSDTEASAGAGLPDPGFPEAPRKKRRRGWIIAGAVVLVLALLIVLPRLLGLGRNMTSAGGPETYTVQRGDITVTLSGSGTLEPADSYTVTSLITGDILTAPFEEGDVVEKDQVLYTVDSSDINNGIQQAQNSVSDSQYKYDSALKQADSLRLKAGGAGTVTTVNVQPGDTVQAGQAVAVIQDSATMRLKVLFQRDVARSFAVGARADVTLDSSNETYAGTIAEIGGVDQVLTGNVIAREVTVTLANPGAIAPGQTAYVSVGGKYGLQNGTFEYNYEGSVTSTISGTVASVSAKAGSRVTKDQVVVTLRSDTVDQQVQSAKSALENAQLSLESQTNKLSNYTIKSPIAGTIVEKDVKAGDTLNTGVVLCTVFDLSHLTLTLNVDELDIKKVQPGQAVTLTAGAAAGTEYTGTVTKINIKGTTKNGVTSYPVTIQIDKAEGLLPGMNVDAKIVVSSMKDVLTVPVGAVLRNNFVLLKTGDSQKSTEPGVPAGYSYTEVTLGPSNDTDIVITSGLQEGDVVALMDNTPTSYDYNPFEPARGQSAGSAETGGSQDQAPQSAAGVAG